MFANGTIMDPRRTDAPRALAGTAQGAYWPQEVEAR